MQLGNELAYGLPQDEYWLPPATDFGNGGGSFGGGDISLTLDLDLEKYGTKPYAPVSPVATSGIVSGLLKQGWQHPYKRIDFKDASLMILYLVVIGNSISKPDE